MKTNVNMVADILLDIKDKFFTTPVETKIQHKLSEVKKHNNVLMNGRKVDKLKGIGQKIGVAILAAIATLVTILALPVLAALVCVAIIKDEIAHTPGIIFVDTQKISPKSWLRRVAPAATFLPYVSYKLCSFFK